MDRVLVKKFNKPEPRIYTYDGTDIVNKKYDVYMASILEDCSIDPNGKFIGGKFIGKCDAEKDQIGIWVNNILTIVDIKDYEIKTVSEGFIDHENNVSCELLWFVVIVNEDPFAFVRNKQLEKIL